MTSLKDSSEIVECATLLQGLLPPNGLAEYITFDLPEPESDNMVKAGRDTLTEVPGTPEYVPELAKTVSSDQEPDQEYIYSDASQAASQAGGHREDALEAALEILCQRGGFSCAIIADDDGLALAEHNPPLNTDVMAAFATVLGGAIAQASHFLDQHEANNISMDINYIDKAVVRKFEARAIPFYLFIICPQDIDERNEIELSLDKIVGILMR